MQPSFRPFEPNGPVRVYCRNLPHWRKKGATYFVTFRQADSIPAEVVAVWLGERDNWYLKHGIDPAWRDSDPERLALVYQRIPSVDRKEFERRAAMQLHEELDHCHGSCIFRSPAPRQILAESLTHFHGTRLWLGDYVIMPNHAHALVVPFEGWKLEDLLGSIKKWTSRLIGRWLDEQPLPMRPIKLHRSRQRFWQYESYDRIVRDRKELIVFRRYIARNPDVANLSETEHTLSVAEWLDEFAPRQT